MMGHKAFKVLREMMVPMVPMVPHRHSLTL